SRSLARGAAALEAQHHDFGFHNLRWPGNHGKAGRDGDLLGAVRRIGDHAAAILSPKFLPVGGIERIKAPANIAEEHNASGRRSHGADDRVVGLHPPRPDAGVGVDGMKPTSPGTVFLAEHVEWIDRRHSGPWLTDRYRPKLIDTLHRHRVAPFDLADHDEVRPGIVGRTVPFRAPHRAGTKMYIVAGCKRYFDIL